MSLSSTTRIGIISDTHGFLDPRVAEVIESCDIAVHAGDIMGQHVLEKMQPRSGKIIAIRGNNDNELIWDKEQHPTLKKLEHYASLELPSGTLVVVHGHLHGGNHPDHAVMRQQFPDARTIVYGHSHKMICDTDTIPWVINPGAAGEIRTRGGPSCLVLEVSETGWEIESIRFADDVIN